MAVIGERREAEEEGLPTEEPSRPPLPPAASRLPTAPYLTRRRFVTVNAILFAGLVTTIVLASLIGSVHVDLARALRSDIPDNVDRVILFETRVPRVLLAAVVGAALAAAGVALQGLMRNPLAEPHLMGVSGGAALGAVIAVIVGGRSAFTESSVLPLAAAAGALVSMAVIYRIALVQGRLQPYMLLLAGVVYNAFAGSLILFVNAVADLYQAQGILFWLMGPEKSRETTRIALEEEGWPTFSEIHRTVRVMASLFERQR